MDLCYHLIKAMDSLQEKKKIVQSIRVKFYTYFHGIYRSPKAHHGP